MSEIPNRRIQNGFSNRNQTSLRAPSNQKFSNNYSGNSMNNDTLKNNSIIKDKNDRPLYNSEYGKIKQDTSMHQYKGMDGKIYYSEQSLDIANRMFLDKKNKEIN